MIRTNTTLDISRNTVLGFGWTGWLLDQGVYMYAILLSGYGSNKYCARYLEKHGIGLQLDVLCTLTTWSVYVGNVAEWLLIEHILR